MDWRHDGTRIIGSVKAYAPKSSGDHGQIGSYISLGASLENIDQVLRHHGYSSKITYRKSDEIHTKIEINLGSQGSSEIGYFEQITLRKTNRSYRNESVIDLAIVESILNEADMRFEYIYIEERQKLKDLGGLLGRAEKIRFTDLQGHQEFYEHELNWNSDQAISRGYGLNMEHFDLSPKKAVGMRISSSPLVIQHINSFQGGEGFATMSEDYFFDPTPILLIHGDYFNHEQFIEAGRSYKKFGSLSPLMELICIPCQQFNSCVHICKETHHYLVRTFKH